jgi:hypothetical protein
MSNFDKVKELKEEYQKGVDTLLSTMVQSGFVDNMIKLEMTTCLNNTLDEIESTINKDEIPLNKREDLRYNIKLCYSLMNLLNYYDFYSAFKEERELLKKAYSDLYDHTKVETDMISDPSY